MSIDGINGISAQSIQGMDIETALMAVQSNRAQLLEAQLKDQVASVQAKNEQIAKLNTVLGALNKIAAQFPGDAKADHKLGDTGANKDDYQMEKDANTAMADAGITPNKDVSGRMNARDGVGTDAAGNTWYTGGVNGSSTKAQIDGTIQQLKSQIDSMSNSQQMDMLRLQSLSNKRNEAFEIMTNFVKKMQDSRSSIVGNMR